MHPAAVNQAAAGPAQTAVTANQDARSSSANQSIESTAPTNQIAEHFAANQLVIDSSRVTLASNQITICEPNLPPPIQTQSITVEGRSQPGDIILTRESHSGSLVMEAESQEGHPKQVEDVIVEEITEDGQRRRLITLKVAISLKLKGAEKFYFTGCCLS